MHLTYKYTLFLESDEFDDIPIKLNAILKEVSYDVEHLPELQVSFYSDWNAFPTTILF